MTHKQQKFAKLFEETKDKLYRVAYNVVLNKEAAEDVLQDSYVKAWNNFDNYDPSKRFMNWMATIVTNTAIDHKRKISKEGPVMSLNATQNIGNENRQLMNFDVEDKNADLIKHYEQQETIEFIAQMISELPNDLRIVMAPFFEGKNYDDVSKITSLSVSTVRARVHRAKKILRNSYNKENFANF
jgi:RNA polymerase sigma-70 factor (ECF subfamily)